MTGESLYPRLEPLLAQIQKPIQYVGGELNAQVKPWDAAAVHWALMYPDAYEVGLPNQGLMILYEVLNERPDALAERTYAVWPDLAGLMREQRRPAVHRRRAPRRRATSTCSASASPPSSATPTCSRRSTSPASRCTPSTATRPTPSSSPAGTPRSTPSRSPTSSTAPSSATASRWSATSPTSSRPGRPQGRPGGRERAAGPAGPGRRRLRAALLRGLLRPPTARSPPSPAPGTTSRRGSASAPSWTSTSGPTRRQPLVPLAESVHERMSVEIFRGCTRGCRFCQAGMITRPVRERTITGIGSMVDAGPRGDRLRGGRAAVAVSRPTTPRSASWPRSSPTGTRAPTPACQPAAAPGSTPSTSRWPTSCPATDGARGLTFAPEGGSERIRRVINKTVSKEDLVRTVTTAYANGWRQVKLYFMCGLPDRDRRGRAGDRRARRRGDPGRPRGQRQQGHPLHRLDRRLRAQAAHPVPVGARRPAPRPSTTGCGCSARRSTRTGGSAAPSACATTTASPA